ncbi:hypothetical protein GEV33_000188 [Tenebrio molitor]|uniref:Gag protein n=1 Tax=Tenebrio molitor TaxID=7067 RepID=A0A8J6HZZ5_TENMO|nr:hypothetical protein GEV33_000188 [Tenebrio molitor]
MATLPEIPEIDDTSMSNKKYVKSVSVSEKIPTSTPNFARQQPQVLQRQKNQRRESAISIEATGNSPTNQQQRHASADIQVQQPQQQSLKGYCITALDANQAKEEELFKFEDEFFDTISSADAIVKTIENTTQQPTNGPSGTGQSPTIGRENPAVKLPNIHLPTFSGVFTEWITFRDSYNALINDNRDLSDIQKFHYLRSSLKSDALSTIEHLTLSNDNYQAAWELIQNRALFSLPTATPKDPKILRQILQTATSHLKALEAIKRPVDHWDDLLIYLISSKFDYQTTVALESTLSTAIPVMKHLTDFLNQRCQILESLEINKINKQLQIQQRSSTHVSSQAKGQDIKQHNVGQAHARSAH